MNITKVVENRLRRVARRQGYVLRRSRARDLRAVSYGKFRLEGHPSFIEDDIWFSGPQVARLLHEPLLGGPPQDYAKGFGS